MSNCLRLPVHIKDKKEVAKMAVKNNEKEKKYVRYQEGADMYSMSVRKFQDLAKDAGAIYKVGKMALVKVAIMDEYLETFKL